MDDHVEAIQATALDQIERWWTRWPTANIGARVFKGHVVVDIDPRNGGTDTWAELTDGHHLPTTLTTRTGSGGLHYWFKRIGFNRQLLGSPEAVRHEAAQLEGLC